MRELSLSHENPDITEATHATIHKARQAAHAPFPATEGRQDARQDLPRRSPHTRGQVVGRRAKTRGLSLRPVLGGAVECFGESGKEVFCVHGAVHHKQALSFPLV